MRALILLLAFRCQQAQATSAPTHAPAPAPPTAAVMKNGKCENCFTSDYSMMQVCDPAAAKAAIADSSVPAVSALPVPTTISVAAGYYCPPGQTYPDQCPEGHFCPGYDSDTNRVDHAAKKLPQEPPLLDRQRPTAEMSVHGEMHRGLRLPGRLCCDSRT